MQPDSFSVQLADGIESIIRHYPAAGRTRLYISHGNGFAVYGYRVFWEPLLEVFDVVLFDMRNHGLNTSAGADGHNYQQMAHDLTTIHKMTERQLGSSKSIGVFHSMSSRAAMKNAVDFGSPFDGLVLYDPPSVPPRGHPLYEAMRGFELKLVQWAWDRQDAFDTPAELEAIYAEARASSRWLPQARADMARAVLKKDSTSGYRLSCARELEASIYLAALTLDLWPTAAALGVPTRLVGADPLGRSGPPTGPANHALAQEGNYDYIGVEHAGHLLQIEKPEECRQALMDFVATI
jgi:pimeloyl-ACP methyl ester carboxylesterase